MLKFWWNLTLLLCGALNGESAVDISISRDLKNIQLSGENATGELLVLESSRDLKLWEMAFASREEQWRFVEDFDWSAVDGSFYRLRKAIRPVIAEDDAWENQITLPQAPFLSEASWLGETQLHFVKFTIFTSDLTRVVSGTKSTP